MGFGLLALGFLSALGMMPNLFVYYSYSIILPAAGGLIMLAALVRLAYYSPYFKLARPFAFAYSLLSVALMPFILLSGGKYISDAFHMVSKSVRILFLFAFFMLLLNGIKGLSAEVGNKKLERRAARNIKIAYFYFSFAVITLFFTVKGYFPLIAAVSDVVFFCLMFSVIYGCYMRIGYEGQDEAIDAKIEKIQKKFKK